MKTFDVIIDTDVGNDIDDTWALVYALTEPSIQVRLISVTEGDVAYKAALVAKTLRCMGRMDIPIVIGRDCGDKNAPLKKWLNGFELRDYSGEILTDLRVAYQRTLTRYPQAKIIALAPFSSLREVVDLIKNQPLIAMAGGVRKGYFGGGVPCPECNVVSNLPAFHEVMKKGKDITLIPLDVCGLTQMEGENYQRVICSDTVAAKLIRENYLLWHKEYEGGARKADPKFSSTILFDLVPFWYLLQEQSFKKERCTLTVDAAGRTVEKGGVFDLDSQSDVGEYCVNVVFANKDEQLMMSRTAQSICREV